MDKRSKKKEKNRGSPPPPPPPAPLAPPVDMPPLIMCVGYPASGKSSFAQALVESHPTHVRRINQDEQGRRACEELIGSLTKAPSSGTLGAIGAVGAKPSTVILDRCNLTKDERQEWLQLAHRVRAWVVFFDVSAEECKWRIVRRLGHPTVKKGGGARIIDSLNGSLQPPSAIEGFERVLSITTFDACNALLEELGCGVYPTSTIPVEQGLVKFPRTRHVYNIGSATRDDLIMSSDEVNATFLHHPLYVEEKIDGANMGLCIRNNKICAQNRSHFVGAAYHPQFKILDKWIAKHSDELWCILGESERYILYGEWMYACHSIHYETLPDWFIAFDLYDMLEDRFYSRPRLQAHLQEQGSSIKMTPLLTDGGIEDIEGIGGTGGAQSFENVEELASLVRTTPSRYYNGLIEGVYVRRSSADGLWTESRGKIVRSDFLSGNQHWTKTKVTQNGLEV